MQINRIYSSILTQLKHFESVKVQNEHKMPIKYLSAYVHVCLFYHQNVVQGSIHELFPSVVKLVIWKTKEN
jgi:hypothetical protein